jgi:hypothetical protein
MDVDTRRETWKTPVELRGNFKTSSMIQYDTSVVDKVKKE